MWGREKKRSINRLKNARRRRNRWLLAILIVASVLTLGWQFVEGEGAEIRKVRAVEAPVMHPETQPRPPTVGAQEGPNGEDAQEAKMPTPPTPLQSCDSLRVLVDPAHPLPPDYVPEDLVSLWAYGIPTLGEDMLLRREAAEHLSRLVSAAAAAGEELVVASAYRSYLQQQGSYGRLRSVYGTGAGRISAPPGRSQHQLGTAVDFTNAWVGYKLRQTFGVTSASWWLTHHAPEYGFVLVAHWLAFLFAAARFSR